MTDMLDGRTPEGRARQSAAMDAFDGRERRIADELRHTPTGSASPEAIIEALVYWERRVEDAFEDWEAARLALVEADSQVGVYRGKLPSDAEAGRIAAAEADWRVGEREYQRCKAARNRMQARLDDYHAAPRGAIW
jgi:hypothetical protein